MSDPLLNPRVSMRSTALGKAGIAGLAMQAFKRKPTLAELGPDGAIVDVKKPAFSEQEINVAYAALMSGPKATPPRWKTVKSFMRQLRAGAGEVPFHMISEGRRIIRFDEKTGDILVLHPTKGLRNAV